MCSLLPSQPDTLLQLKLGIDQRIKRILRIIHNMPDDGRTDSFTQTEQDVIRKPLAEFNQNVICESRKSLCKPEREDSLMNDEKYDQPPLMEVRDILGGYNFTVGEHYTSEKKNVTPEGIQDRIFNQVDLVQSISDIADFDDDPRGSSFSSHLRIEERRQARKASWAQRRQRSQKPENSQKPEKQLKMKRIKVSDGCKEKMQMEVARNLGRKRKQFLDNKLKMNLIRKIEEKYAE